MRDFGKLGEEGIRIMVQDFNLNSSMQKFSQGNLYFLHNFGSKHLSRLLDLWRSKVISNVLFVFIRQKKLVEFPKDFFELH